MTDIAQMTPGRRAASDGHRTAARFVRRLIRRSPVVRSIVKDAHVQHQIMTWRALSVVRGHRARFLMRQFVRGGTAVYELRDSELKFHVRHRTGDVAILNKIFTRERLRNSYLPPAEAVAVLGSAPRILDLGANIGLFGVHVLRTWPDAEIIAFEPDPDNLRVLRRTVSANAVGTRWKVVPVAVANAPSELSFVAGLQAEAHVADARETGTIRVEAVDLFAQGGWVDLIKMDIEGGEWAILGDPRLAALRTSMIRLEWHTMLCPDPDPRRTAIRLLRIGGFTRIVDVDGESGPNGVLWAWREPTVAEGA